MPVAPGGRQPPGSHLWLVLAELAGVVVIAFTLTAALFRRRAASA